MYTRIGEEKKMTNDHKEIVNLGNTIQGEINRMCVTKSIEELDSMCLYAINNIMKLRNARTKELRLKAWESKE